MTSGPLQPKNADASKGEIRYSAWYNQAHKIVFSRTLEQSQEGNTTVFQGDITVEIARLKTMPGKQMLIFGSPAISQQLMRANLIDRYWIFINPSIFGKGIALV